MAFPLQYFKQADVTYSTERGILRQLRVGHYVVDLDEKGVRLFVKVQPNLGLVTTVLAKKPQTMRPKRLYLTYDGETLHFEALDLSMEVPMDELVNRFILQELGGLRSQETKRVEIEIKKRGTSVGSTPM